MYYHTLSCIYESFYVDNCSTVHDYMLPSQKNICLTLIHYLSLDCARLNCYMGSPVESLMEKLGSKLVAYDQLE